MPDRPGRHRLLSGSCSSARSFAPRFLPTLGRPHAVALHFVRCDQLTAGLAPARVRPCWAHMRKTLYGSWRVPTSIPGEPRQQLLDFDRSELPLDDIAADGGGVAASELVRHT